MDEGFTIPIGGDLTGLQASFDAVIASIEKLGTQIQASFERTNAVIASSVARMGAFSASVHGAAAAQGQAGNASALVASHFARTAQEASNVSNVFIVMNSAMTVVARASRTLNGIGLAGTLNQWIASAGGIRAAFARIPEAMIAIAKNPTFQKIALGAAAAITAIVAIRAAWKTAAAGIHLLSSAAAGVFHGIIAGARTAGRAVASAFSGIASLPGRMMNLPGVGVGSMIGGIGGIAGAITLAVSSIGKAADMETLQTAFAPLLGGADAAQKRIAELAQFAAATPFELPEVARASRVLETLTRGALSTGKGLTLAGDVASGTGQPFEELAMWIGRMYDGLQNGRPVGESLMRLQELGVVSGDVRGRIEALQATGAKGAEVWGVAAAALGRFSGSMERQSQTWTGKLSTFNDALHMTMAAFGAPIIDGLKPFLDMAINRMESLKSAATAMGNKIRDAFDGALATWQTSNIAEVIGAGLTLAVIDGVNAFSSGIRETVAYLGAALTSIMASVKDSWGAQEFLGILKNLGEGLAAMITAAILKAIDAIPGIDVTQDAQREAHTAGNKFRQAGNRIGDFDGADAVQKSIDALRKANEKGLAAAAEAGKDLLLDRGPAATKFSVVWKSVQERIDRNRAQMAEEMKTLDDKLKNASPSAPGGAIDLASKITKAASPAVMSLTRIGGGGFSNTVIHNLVSEAKRHTGLLKTIATNTANQPSIVATYT